MKFANVISYIPDAERVQSFRIAHRDYAAGLMQQGKLVIAGPFEDGAGALMVYEAASREEAESFALNDPFWINGVWSKYEIHPWQVLSANHGLLPS